MTVKTTDNRTNTADKSRLIPCAAGDNEELDNKTFNEIKDFVYEKCGISLGDRKKALVSARIRKRMRALQIINPRDYFKHILGDSSGVEMVLLLDAISTNVTSFFREPAHLSFLKETTAAWIKEGRNKLRFWSAACSSGEEPYSMAFAVKDAIESSGRSSYDARILATDISTKVLAAAGEGIYEKEKVEPVPGLYAGKYLEKIKDACGERFMVRQNIKEMVSISRMNLTEMPFPMSGPMDVIFCRNVMIYFDKNLRRKLVDEFRRLLRPGGYLIIGHTESLIDINGAFKRTGPSIYLK